MIKFTIPTITKSTRLLIECLIAIGLCIAVLYWLAKFGLSRHGIILPTIIEHLINGKKQPEFITDTATFFGVVLGIAIPFGIEVVQTVSKSFSNSKTLRQRFRDEWQMVLLVPFYIATVMWAITARLFINGNNPELQKAVSFTLLLCLLIGFAIFAKYIQRLYVYTLEQEELKSEYKDDLLRTIGTNKKKFQAYVEGFGDIAVTEAKNNDSKALLTDSLPFLEHLVEQIVPKGNLEVAEKFLLEDEYWELYNKGEQARPEDDNDPDDDLAPRIIDYREEAKLRVAFNPEKYLATYTNTVQQLERIYRAGIEIKDSEITSNAIYSYVRILKYLTSESGRSLYVDLLLQKMTSLLEEAILRDDVSKYSLASDWYTTVVFDRFSKRTRKFKLEYLELLDRFLYSNLKFLVTRNQKTLFMAFIGRLVDGGMGYHYLSHVWDLSNMLPLAIHNSKPEVYEEVQKVSQELEHSIGQVSTPEELEEWAKKLTRLKDLVVQSLTKKEDKKAAEKTFLKNYAEVEDLLKSKNMLSQIFSVGAYCMFKQKYEYVKEMLDYKQPDDSDASWGGADVQPSKPNALLTFYYRRGFYDRDRHFFEGHHGSGMYVTEYFLVLFLYALKRNPNEAISIGDIVTPTRLSDISFTAPNLINTAQSRLISNSELMTTFGFTNNDVETILVPALEQIKTQADSKLNSLEQSGDVDDDKVNDFKECVVNTYKNETVLRGLFESFGKSAVVENKDSEKTSTRFGIATVDDKAPFFKEWNVSYGDWGTQYGSNLANSEDRYLYERLKGQSHVTYTQIEAAIKEVKIETTIILMPRQALYRYDNDKKFVPKWDLTSNGHTHLQELNGYYGYFELGNKKIAAFEIGYLNQFNELLVVDFGTIGILKTLSPEGPENTNKDVNGHIAIRVDAFSKDEDLLQQYLSKPPKWLVDKGDAEQQKVYLMKKVLIRIFEKFKLPKTKKPSVYLVKFEDQDFKI